jgi:hypothetical protein
MGALEKLPLLEVSDMGNNATEGEPCLYCGKPAVRKVHVQASCSVCAACHKEIEGDRVFENTQREYDAMVARWRSEC